ncbi:hypothetical protein [Aneurinibacillus terranovensis]|uniref:hypothetical protein n=1 Tax=Aneurinibacillus terranovensis TaxID=278991 RepID=UPI0004163155|nr:hypothetical protein [Aneurinibacillus terranovensis]
MNKKEIQTELFCGACLKDSLHTIVYLNGNIYKLTCEECGHTITKPDVVKDIYGEYLERILSKPHRLKDEIEKHPSKTISSLPSRIISKPFRFYKELEGLRSYVYKKKKTDEKDVK